MVYLNLMILVFKDIVKNIVIYYWSTLGSYVNYNKGQGSDVGTKKQISQKSFRLWPADNGLDESISDIPKSGL